MLLEGDESGWVQMLIFAVIIGFSALSRFAAQRKQKRHLERQEQARRQPGQPVRRATPSSGSQPRSAAPREPQPRPGVQRERQPGPGMESEPPPRPASEDPRRREAAGRAKPRTIIRPGSALSAFVAEIKQEIKKAADQMQGVTPAQPKAITKPKPPPATIAEPVFEPQERKPPVRGAAKDEIEEWGAGVPELSGPEDLKRAVLYYEILGKPVSMRGPSEHLIG